MPRLPVSLLKLTLENLPRLETVPESIGALTNLEELKISCCGLTHLSASIEALIALKSLELIVVRNVNAGKLQKLQRCGVEVVDGQARAYIIDERYGYRIYCEDELRSIVSTAFKTLCFALPCLKGLLHLNLAILDFRSGDTDEYGVDGAFSDDSDGIDSDMYIDEERDVLEIGQSLKAWPPPNLLDLGFGFPNFLHFSMFDPQPHAFASKPRDTCVHLWQVLVAVKSCSLQTKRALACSWSPTSCTCVGQPGYSALLSSAAGQGVGVQQRIAPSPRICVLRVSPP